MHQVRLVEGMAIEFALFRILHDDLRGLRDAGQQFVRGVGRVDDGVFRARAILADGVHVFVKVVEGRMRQPGFVEVQGFHLAVKRFLQGLHVIEHTVVGGLRNGQNARPGLLVLDERVRLDFLADIFELEFLQRNRPDDAQMIARRHQEHRVGAGHDDRMQDRFMAVAVDDNGIAGRHIGMPHHLVRGGGAISNEEAVVGIENARRIALGGAHRTIVVEQLAQFLHCITNICAQHVFTEKLMEHLANGRLQKCHPTGVPRTVP